MVKRKNRLEDLDVREVSLVDRAANKRKFLLTKNEGGHFMSMDDVLKSILELDLDNEKDIDKEIEKAELSEDAVKGLKSALKILQSFRDELPDSVMNKLTNLAGITDKKETKKEKGQDMDVENMKEEDIEKMEVPAVMKEQLKTLLKEKEKAEDFRKQLEKERNEKMKKEFIAKAKDYDALSVKAEDFGLVLKSIYENSKEDYEAVAKVLKAANEQIEQGELFKTKGSDFEGSGGDTWTKIEQMAKTIQENDPKVSKAAAINKALEQNPDLYDAYLNEGGQ